MDGKVVDAVDVFVGGASGPQAIQGIKILESVPCDALPQVLEGLIRHADPEKIRRQLRAFAPASPAPADSAPPAPMPVTDTRPVMLPADIAEGTGKTLTVNGTDVAVFRAGGQLCAIANRCPHAGGSLADGVLDGDEVICPLHNYRFDVKTGACSTDPTLRVKTFTVVQNAGGFTVEA